MAKYEIKPSLSQAIRLKKMKQDKALTPESIDSVLSETKFKADSHIQVLSNIKPGQEVNTFQSVYGDIACTLPHVKEIESQFYSAGLLDALSGKDAKKYNVEIKHLTKEAFALE
jgi:hypothetical protein